MTPQTYIVERCYQTGNGWHAVLKGLPLSYRVDEKLPEGTAVRTEGNRAVKA